MGNPSHNQTCSFAQPGDTNLLPEFVLVTGDNLEPEYSESYLLMTTKKKGSWHTGHGAHCHRIQNRKEFQLCGHVHDGVSKSSATHLEIVWKYIFKHTHTHIYLGPTETSIIQYRMKNWPLSPTPMRRIFVPQVRHKKANCNDEVESMAG